MDIRKPDAILYLTLCLVNGKIYIGKTVRVDDIYYIGGGTVLNKAIKKYGRENFVQMTLMRFYGPNAENEAYAMEKVFVTTEWCERSDNYNVIEGGLGRQEGYKHTKESKEKISAICKGKKRSEETKKKMSEMRKGMTSPRKGVKLTEVTKSKMRKAWETRPPISEETKRKISESNKGRISPTKGVKMSEETKRKISESNKGRKMSKKNKILLGKRTEKPCIIDGISYKSQKEASILLKVSTATINRRVNRNAA